MRPVAVRNVFDKKRALPRMVSSATRHPIHDLRVADHSTELGARESIQPMATYSIRQLIDSRNGFHSNIHDIISTALESPSSDQRISRRSHRYNRIREMVSTPIATFDPFVNIIITEQYEFIIEMDRGQRAGRGEDEG